MKSNDNITEAEHNKTKYVIIGNAESPHLLKWVEELVKYFDVYIISSQNTHADIKEIIQERNIFNLNLNVSGIGGNSGMLFKIPRIRKILKTIDPQIVNAHYITSHGFIAALIRFIFPFHFKLVSSAWGTDILVTPDRNFIYRSITRFALTRCDLITSDSNHMTGRIKELTDTETMTFVFGISEIPEITLSEKDNNLFFSNRALTENYNIHEVIQLFEKVSGKDKNKRLIISNDGDQRKKLEDYVTRKSRQQQIVFTGFIAAEKQNELYQKAQFYISIPTSDSTSVSLIEAMASGCIPIVSDLHANREWVTHKTNGIIYTKETVAKDIEDVLSMKDKIFIYNREMIRDNGIFPELMKKYIERINTL